MDLSISVGDSKLKIRVAGLIKTEKGYIFEKSEKGYLFPVGGKIMVNEPSKKAIIREIKEELNIDIEGFVLKSVLENFYTKASEKVHEICFVYETTEKFSGPLPADFIDIPVSEFSKYDIQPVAIKNMLLNRVDKN